MDTIIAPLLARDTDMAIQTTRPSAEAYVRAAVLNGDLRERLTYKPPKQAHRSRTAWMFEPTPPLLKTA
jgi:hypothetical protein